MPRVVSGAGAGSRSRFRAAASTATSGSGTGPSTAPIAIVNRRGGGSFELTPDIAGLRVLFVNIYFVGASGPGPRDWVLVDAGLPLSAGRIRDAAELRFGPGARPRAILLTHGHFDHVGALRALAREWNVPVYAHEMELPYLTGRSQFPPGDMTAGGGFMTRMAPCYPRGPIDLGRRVRPLPGDGTVPDLPGWRWIATPGHSPGHVSYFRDTDRVLLAGDAVITTRQESLMAVLQQRPELRGPPRYFTCDWAAAWTSVQRLADLHPALLATGHGPPLEGPELDRALQRLAREFDRVAVPRRGRYVRQAAVTDKTGLVRAPRPRLDPMVVGGAIGLAALGAWWWLRERDEDCG